MGASFYSRIIKSYFWTVFAYAISFARQFILVPLFLKYVGKEKYAFWLLAMAAVGVIMTINHGYFQYVSNKINLTYRINKSKAVKEFKSAFRFSLIQLIILLILVILMSTNLIFPYVVKIDLNSVLNHKINLVFLFLAISSLIFSVFSGLLAKLYEPVKKENYLYRFNFIYNILDLIVLIFSVWLIKDLFLIAILLTVFRLIVLFIFAINIKNVAPDFYPWWNEGNIKEELVTFKKSLFLLFSNFIERFQHDGLVLYISHYISESIVPLFSATRTIGNSATGGVASIINPTLPEMQANFAAKNWRRISDIIFFNLSLSGFVISIFFIILSPFAKTLFEIWTNNELKFDEAFYFYIVATSILFNFSYNFLSIIRAFNYTKETFSIVVIKVTLLFTIPLFLVRSLESIGMAMLFSEIAGLLVAMNFLILLFSNTSKGEIIRIIILSFIPSLFAIYGVYLTLNSSINLYLIIFIYLILFSVNLFFNGKNLILKLYENKPKQGE